MYYHIALFILLIVGSHASMVRYDGYKVYRVTPENTYQQQVLKSLGKNEFVDVWRSSQMLHQPWDLMVKPDHANNLESVLHLSKINFEITTNNVEDLLDRSTPTHSLRRAGISFQQYNRYSTIQSYLKTLAATYPETVTLLNIGKTYENRDILGLKISSGGSNKPAILVDAGIHAREWMAPATALYIINQLVENSNNANLYKNVDWYIIPSLNPDGYEYTHTTDRMWRKTRSQGKVCKGVDPNRNFGFHWNEVGTSDQECSEVYSGPRAFSERETAALRDFALKLENVKLYLTFHSYGQYLLYPWGYTEDYPENADELQRLGELVNDAISSVRGTEYTIGSSTNVLYPAAGGSDDWVKAVAGVPLAYTIELPGYGFQPAASQILGVVTETFEGVKAYHKYIENNSA